MSGVSLFCHRHRHRRSRAGLALLLAWLVARSFLPTGFMPGPEGGLVACQSAAAAPLENSAPGPADHIDAPCLFAVDALPPLLPAVPVLASVAAFSLGNARLPSTFVPPIVAPGANRARAPPFHSVV